MTKLFDMDLIPNERIIDKSTTSLSFYLVQYLLSFTLIGASLYLYFNNILSVEITNELIILASIFGSGIIVLILTLIFNKSRVLIITNERLIYKYGILNTNVVDVDIDKILNSKAKQSIIGKLLNYGTLEIDTGGSEGFEADIKGVPNIGKRRSVIKLAMEGRYNNTKEEKEIRKEAEEKALKKRSQVLEALKRKDEKQKEEERKKKELYERLEKLKK